MSDAATPREAATPGDAPATRSHALARLVALTRKETRQLLRDPSSLAIGILLPILLILLFGYGLSLDVKNAPLALVMEDSSPTATQAMAGLSLTPYISPVPLVSMKEAEALLREHKVDGNPYQPLPTSVREHLQADIEGLYQMFVQAVARHRGMEVQTVRDTRAAAPAQDGGVAAAGAGLSESFGNPAGGPFALDQSREDADAQMRCPPVQRGQHVAQCGSLQAADDGDVAREFR